MIFLRTGHMDPYSIFRRSDERSGCSLLSNSSPGIYLRTSRWEYHVTPWEPAQKSGPKFVATGIWTLWSECPSQSSADANRDKFHYNQSLSSETPLNISDKYRSGLALVSIPQVQPLAVSDMFTADMICSSALHCSWRTHGRKGSETEHVVCFTVLNLAVP